MKSEVAENSRRGGAEEIKSEIFAKHKNGRTALLPFSLISNKNWGPYFPRLTAFFNSAPGVNFATRRAAILMVAPVCGLRPLRAFLCDTEKVPKPMSATLSPFLSAAVMLSTDVSTAIAACALLIRLPAAIRG